MFLDGNGIRIRNRPDPFEHKLLKLSECFDLSHVLYSPFHGLFISEASTTRKYGEYASTPVKPPFKFCGENAGHQERATNLAARNLVLLGQRFVLLRKISRKQNERSFFQISVSFLSAMRSILKNERLICLRKISRSENERWFFQASVWFLPAMRSISKNERLICLRKISRSENERSFFQISVSFLLAIRSILKNERLISLRKISRSENERSFLKNSRSRNKNQRSTTYLTEETWHVAC